MFRLAVFSSSPFVILNPANVSMPHILLEHIWGVITLDKQIFSGLYNFAWNKALAVLGNSNIRLTRYVNTRNVIIAHWQTGRSCRCAHTGKSWWGESGKATKTRFSIELKVRSREPWKTGRQKKMSSSLKEKQYPSPTYVKPSVKSSLDLSCYGHVYRGY